MISRLVEPGVSDCSGNTGKSETTKQFQYLCLLSTGASRSRKSLRLSTQRHSMIGNALLFALTLFMAFAFLLGAHLFIWSGTQFSQSLPQLAIDWEVSSAKAHFFLVRTRAHRRNTKIKRLSRESEAFFCYSRATRLSKVPSRRSSSWRSS